MPFSILLGVWTDEQDGDGPGCHWPALTLPEADGCDPERVPPGEPRRNMGLDALNDWLRAMPKVGAILAAAGCPYPRGGDAVCPLAQVYGLIQALPEGKGYNQDRVRWLRYWSRRAVEEYGDRAVIAFST
mgnify:CR=1 FL=1